MLVAMVVPMATVVVVVIVARVMPMAMGMAVPRAIMAVGAALGIERALHAAHLGAEAAGHVGDDVVVADVDDARADLGGEVAVAEVPGDAGERPLVAAGDLQQPLGRRLDGDDAAVLQAEAVAGGEHRGLGEVEQEAEAASPGQRDATPGAVVVVEADDVGRLRIPEAGAEELSVSSQQSMHSRRGSSDVASGLPLTPALSPRLDRGEVAMRGEVTNKKYRCAIGSTLAGSQVRSSPSARTS